MTDVVLATRDLTKVYDGRAVVDGLDWTLERGSACALLGPNGAGKTTTLRMLMGFVPPSRGECSLFGVDAWEPPAEVKARVGFVSDQLSLPPWTRAGALIRFHASFYPRWNARREKELVDLFAIRLDARIGSLSKGQHRRLMLLLALSQGSELLLLDEPASGLDLESRRSFLGLLGEFLGAGDTSLVFSTHLLTDVERIATDVLVLCEGRAVEQCSLDTLQEEVRAVTMSRELHEGTRETWDAAGVLRSSDSNGNLSLVVRRFSGELEALARSLPPASLHVQTLPLEDVYLAITTGDRSHTP